MPLRELATSTSFGRGVVETLLHGTAGRELGLWGLGTSACREVGDCGAGHARRACATSVLGTSLVSWPARFSLWRARYCAAIASLAALRAWRVAPDNAIERGRYRIRREQPHQNRHELSSLRMW